MIRRSTFLVPLAAIFALALPAAANADPTIAAGTRVVDTAGAEVGTVTAIQGDNLVVKTDKHEVALPRTSFGAGGNDLVLALTRDQLNAEVEKTLAAQGPLLSTGATVYDPQGGIVGTVEEFDEQFATLKLSKRSVKLPVSAFARGPNGPIIGETADSLEAKAAAAK